MKQEPGCPDSSSYHSGGCFHFFLLSKVFNFCYRKGYLWDPPHQLLISLSYIPVSLDHITEWGKCGPLVLLQDWIWTQFLVFGCVWTDIWGWAQGPLSGRREKQSPGSRSRDCGTGPGRCSCPAGLDHRASLMLLAGKGQKWPPSSTSEPDVNQALKLGQELWPCSWAGGLQLVG